MNKILIALVLAVVMSGNAYAQDKLYYICIDAENRSETWKIDKSKKSATKSFIRETGIIEETEYQIKINEIIIGIGYYEKGLLKLFEAYYFLDRKTLEFLSFPDKTIKGTINIYSPDFCKVSDELMTRGFRKKTSTAKKLRYEKSIKF